jgi:hypothetical protein
MLSAQTILTLHGGVDSRTGIFSPEPSNSSIESWKSGTSGSAGVDYFVQKSIALSGSVEYNSYPFDTYRYAGVSIPEIWLKSSSGNTSQIYRALLEGKLFFSADRTFSLYLLTGISYTAEHIGEIRLTYGNMNGPDFSIVKSNQSINYWMHTFGLGSRYFISDQIGIDIIGKWYANYSTRFHKSLNFGVVYIL